MGRGRRSQLTQCPAPRDHERQPGSSTKKRFLIGSPDDDLTALCQARLCGQKIRKNAVYAVRLIPLNSDGKDSRPIATHLAAGGLLFKDKLKPYLEGRADLFVAQGRDKRCEEYARYLAQNFHRVKRLLPERGQTWNYEGRLHKEEIGKVLSVESTRLKGGPAEKADKSLKPAAGFGR